MADREEESNAPKDKLGKSFEIPNRRTLIIFKDEYETYWVDNIRDRFSGFRDPIFSNERSEATVSVEFESALATAMGHMPYFGDPTEHPDGFKKWKEEGRGEFSDILILLKTALPDTFIHSVIFDENLSDKKLIRSEEEIVQKAIKSCGLDVSPVDISKMFAKLLINYAGQSVSSAIKNSNSSQEANVIDKFLEYWGEILLVPEHQASLAKIASFMKGDFEKLSEKITDDTVSFVLSQQKNLILKLEELYKHEKL